MYDKAPVAVMAVCPGESFKIPKTFEACFWQVESGQEAFEIMRVVSVDLLLVSMDLPDIDVWQFVRKVKIRNSHAKWVLLSDQLDSRQEIQARTLGVVRIFYTTPDIGELYEMAVRIKQNEKLQKYLS
jgi:DNA-binding NarL/FixJ family response regulator